MIKYFKNVANMIVPLVGSVGQHTSRDMDRMYSLNEFTDDETVSFCMIYSVGVACVCVCIGVCVCV